MNEIETLSKLAGVKTTRISMRGGQPVFFVRGGNKGELLFDGESFYREELIQILNARIAGKDSTKGR
jgi:hypothetical protein